jgi:predicted nucleic acid-binding protein
MLQDEFSGQAEAVLRKIVEGQFQLVQPELWWYETINLLRSAILRKRMTETGARKALFFLKEIPLEHVPIARENEFMVLENAIRHQLTGYDAAYFTLAQERGATLLTADRDLLALRKSYSFIAPLG